ncbi:MAG: rod shape-determining protein RodA, partial [Acidobacteria bacterium]
MRKALSFRDFDWLLLLLVLAIATIGVLQIYSTTAHTVLASQYKKQIYWVALGCFLAIVASRLDYHIVLEHIPWIYVASVLALGVVL